MKKHSLIIEGGIEDRHVTLITGCWFLPPKVVGMTLSKRLILTRPKTPSVYVLAHELTHIFQYERHRWFIFMYVWEFLKHGVLMKNKYESDAYNCVLDNVEHFNFMVD